MRSLWSGVPICNARGGEDETRVAAIGQSKGAMETLAPTWLADDFAALDRDEIEVLFQPQFAALSGQSDRGRGAGPLAASAARTDGRGTLFTGSRRRDQAARLSRHVARAALAAAEWPAPLRLSLNVTAGDLAGGRLCRLDRARTAAEAGFPAERLTLEITEQALLAELDRPATRLRQLAGLGMRIALDDFGAGFCNFNYLKRLPLHCLKLDRSMIAGHRRGSARPGGAAARSSPWPRRWGSR